MTQNKLEPKSGSIRDREIHALVTTFGMAHASFRLRAEVESKRISQKDDTDFSQSDLIQFSPFNSIHNFIPLCRPRREKPTLRSPTR